MFQNRFIEKARKKYKNKKTNYKVSKAVVPVKVVSSRPKANPNSFPKRPLLGLSKWAKLPYYDFAALSTGAGTANSVVYTANGLFDPYAAVGGHQPMGFDQIMLLYEHYTVTNCKVVVTCSNSSSTNSVVMGLYITADGVNEPNIAKLVENGQIKRKWLQALDNCSTTISMNVNLAKQNQKKILNEDDYRGDVAANPVEQTYIHVFAFCEPSTALVNCFYNIHLEYTAKFTEPRMMIQS